MVFILRYMIFLVALMTKRFVTLNTYPYFFLFSIEIGTFVALIEFHSIIIKK